jgi:hypothetical protein
VLKAIFYIAEKMLENRNIIPRTEPIKIFKIAFFNQFIFTENSYSYLLPFILPRKFLTLTTGSKPI